MICVITTDKTFMPNGNLKYPQSLTFGLFKRSMQHTSKATIVRITTPPTARPTIKCVSSNPSCF